MSALEAVIAYAARGWPVFPCWWPLPDGSCACPKPQCGNIGKHPLGTAVPRGRNDGTCDLDTIRAWFQQWPEANVAIVTGPESGLVVLDVDPAHGGEESLIQLEYDHGALPETPVSLTGGGGSHSFFAHPGDRKVTNRVGLPAYTGLDVRADGGYVIAPPSLHRSGRSYTWNMMLHSDDVKLAPCPEWLIELANMSAKPNGAVANDPTDPRRIPQGKRNATLASLAGSMQRRGMTLDAIAAALLVENANRCSPSLLDAEVRAIAASIGRYPPVQRARKSADAVYESASLVSDFANALRLARLSRGRLLYCDALGWMTWNGSKWNVDEPSTLREVANTIGRAVAREAADLASDSAVGPDEREQSRGRAEKLLRWARESEREPRIRATLSLARADFAVSADALDALPRRLATPSGIVDLTSGDVRPPTPEDLVTRCTAVGYNPSERSDLWDRVLAHALPDPALRNYFQRAIGYAAVGDPSEDLLFVVHGPAAAAKSTIMGAIAEAFGELAVILGLDDLAERDRGGGARPELVRLRGRRLALAYETGKKLRLDAALVKLLAGGDRIQARDLYRSPMEFRPSCVIVLVGNHRPHAAADDDALWRRLVEIPFAVPLGERERDPTVRARLRDPKADLPAVLAWIVEGARQYLAQGLGPRPASVEQATSDYRAAMDPIGKWIAAQCTLAPHAWTPTALLTAAYGEWCADTGEIPLGDVALVDALRRLGCVAARRHGGRGWRGIGLNEGSVTP